MFQLTSPSAQKHVCESPCLSAESRYMLPSFTAQDFIGRRAVDHCIYTALARIGPHLGKGFEWDWLFLP